MTSPIASPICPSFMYASARHMRSSGEFGAVYRKKKKKRKKQKKRYF
jgi:hypothetical protein